MFDKFSYEPTLCQANLLEAEFQLKGSDAYAARFGQIIADLGDLDDDGYPGKSTSLNFTAHCHLFFTMQSLQKPSLQLQCRTVLLDSYYTAFSKCADAKLHRITNQRVEKYFLVC